MYINWELFRVILIVDAILFGIMTYVFYRFYKTIYGPIERRRNGSEERD
jgi:hypothetical protein